MAKQRGGQRKPLEEKSENRTVGLPRKLWAQVDKMPGTLAGRMRLIVAAGLQAQAIEKALRDLCAAMPEMAQWSESQWPEYTAAMKIIAGLDALGGFDNGEK